jgi:hypothetical protein
MHVVPGGWEGGFTMAPKVKPVVQIVLPVTDTVNCAVQEVI